MKIKKEFILEGQPKIHSFKGTEYIYNMIYDKFQGSEVLVYFDPDVDGLVSGLLACRVLSNLGIKFTWYINSMREHGFNLPLESVRGRNLLCVDFLITQEKMEELVNAGCNVLSIDHHDNGDEFIYHHSPDGGNFGFVVNNQYDFEEESSRYLSGAGVVFEYFCSLVGGFNTRENRALVGLSLLTDIRDIENINARLYLQELYLHPYKGYIGYLLDNTVGSVDYGFGLPCLDRNFVDFNFSPIINSCLRFGAQDEVVEFFLGSGHISKEYHKLQKDLVQKMLDSSRVIPFSNINIVIIDKSNFVGTQYEPFLSCFVGLIASRYLDGKRSAIAYLVEGGNVGRASFRGRVNGLDYLSVIKKRINGVGHGSAFGIKGLKPSKELFTWVNDVCREVEISADTSVNYITTSNLSVFANSRGYSMAVDNIYFLSQNRSYVRYLGGNVKARRSSTKYKEYDIDGIIVKSFDTELDPCRDYIMPILERGVLCFYLNKRAEE